MHAKQEAILLKSDHLVQVAKTLLTLFKPASKYMAVKVESDLPICPEDVYNIWGMSVYICKITSSCPVVRLHVHNFIPS